MTTFAPLHSNHDKLRKVFARLDASDESGRQVAFNIAGRALKEMGVSWSDLLEAHIAPKGLRSDNLRASAETSRAFSDIFDGIFNDPTSPFGAQAQQARPSNDPAPKPRPRYVDGASAPHAIFGTITINDERKTRTGRMIVVTVEDPFRTVYGPFVIFDDAAINLVKSAPGGGFNMLVRQPHIAVGKHMPVLFNIRAQ